MHHLMAKSVATSSYFALLTLSETTLKGPERRQRHIAEPAGQRVQGRLRLTSSSSSFSQVYSHFHSQFLFAHKNGLQII